MLDPTEIAAFWQLGVTLPASALPEEELVRAIREVRVMVARSYSCMGTAETYWGLPQPGDTVERLREEAVVLPPGKRAEETPYADRADDRRIDQVLWRPLFAEQFFALYAHLPRPVGSAFHSEYERLCEDHRLRPERLELLRRMLAAVPGPPQRD